MANGSPMFLVESSALPGVFSQVIRAKQLLAEGQAKSVAEAARMCGISRGAFYKYKDSVFVYNESAGGRILNLQLLLEDRPGVLSALIAALYRAGANILTLNQSIPAGGCAPVSVSARADGGVRLDELMNSLQALEGVRSIQQVSEE